jgi:hypothetical protein
MLNIAHSQNIRGAAAMDQFERNIPSAAKAAVDFATLTARLKPCPFKTNSN